MTLTWLIHIHFKHFRDDALLPPSAISSQGLKDIFMITRLEMQPKIETKKYPKNSDIFVTETLQKSNLHRKPTTHQNHQKHNVVSHTKNLNAPIEWNAYSSSKTYHRQAGIFWLHQNSSRIKWKKLQNYTPVKRCKCMLWFWFDSHSVVGRQPAAAHVHHILSHISAREPTNQLVESWKKMIKVIAL